MTDTKPSVLFVCVHNAGRSQMAAGYLRHFAGDRIEVRSAGSMPADQINPAAVVAMLEDGIDITTEQPKVLTDEAVEASDVVITMGCGDTCRFYAGKRYEDWVVEDPAGQGIDAVRPIRDEIKSRIANLVAELDPRLIATTGLALSPDSADNKRRLDVVVIGGGQAGLAAGYYLRRAGVHFVILDSGYAPGGAWQHGWESLRLFSPAEYSPLPGWRMPQQEGETYPTAKHVVAYLTEYERRYDLPVERPVRVDSVDRDGDGFIVDTNQGSWHARYVISATGTWGAPFLPDYLGSEEFSGEQLHTVEYRSPEPFRNKRVVVVGGGNSAAQVLAEVSLVAETKWVTLREPRFMPDNVDGRVLFDVASQREAAKRAGISAPGVSAIGDVVMVSSVLAARDRGVLHRAPMFDRLTPTGIAWDDGTQWQCDAIIWCTGFQPVLDHLAPLRLTFERGRPKTVQGTRAADEPDLHLLGYGDWTGTASATIVGAGRTAKLAVAEIISAMP